MHAAVGVCHLKAVCELEFHTNPNPAATRKDEGEPTPFCNTRQNNEPQKCVCTDNCVFMMISMDKTCLPFLCVSMKGRWCALHRCSYTICMHVCCVDVQLHLLWYAESITFKCSCSFVLHKMSWLITTETKNVTYKPYNDLNNNNM